MCDSIDAYCDVWKEEIRKARKNHYCDCCEAAIRRGDTYIVVSSVFEGTASSEKQCQACLRAIVKFAAESGHMKWMPSGFIEVLEDCIRWDAKSAKKWRPTLKAIQARRDTLKWRPW